MKENMSTRHARIRRLTSNRSLSVQDVREGLKEGLRCLLEETEAFCGMTGRRKLQT
jgi:hypothetical protein